MLLTDDEAQALCYQSNHSDVEGRLMPLALTLEVANNWQTKIYEVDDIVRQYNFTVLPTS
jgi:hypothetical protein